MWEEYIGELRTVVGLDFLNGEGEGPLDHVEEADAGLWGELGTDVSYLKARTIVDGVVEVLLQGFWTTLQVQERQVLDVYLDPLAWDSHGVALRLLARSGASLAYQAGSLQDTVDTIDADGYAFLGQVE